MTLLLLIACVVGGPIVNILIYRRGYMTGWKDSAEHAKMMQGRP